MSGEENALKDIANLFWRKDLSKFQFQGFLF